ncbi:uncharacterized protein LOC117895057 [Drosophila subobscura]|uniref:uncharacterized protein LOC117895057 n=1 Tax=Drosophila subobscura TaxID=7241 RepID=UPI00155A7FF4|nr:uncharacterized protein LOC117895057 [Drosophila subobscura]
MNSERNQNNSGCGALITQMAENNNKSECIQPKDTKTPNETVNSSSDETSSSSGDIENSRYGKLRRRSVRSFSYHFQSLPMRVVGDQSAPIAGHPSSARDVTLSSAHIIEDSSESDFHISNDTSNDEPPIKPIAFVGRSLRKTDVNFIKRRNKRKKRTKKKIFKE